MQTRGEPSVPSGVLSRHTAVTVIRSETGKALIITPNRSFLLDPADEVVNDILDSLDANKTIDPERIGASSSEKAKQLLAWLHNEKILTRERASTSDSFSSIVAFLGSKDSTTPYRVYIEGEGHLATQVRELVSISGIPVVTTSQDAIWIVAEDQEDQHKLLEANRRLVNNGAKGFFVSVSGACMRLGPTIIARQTACFECFHKRAFASVARPEIWNLLQRANSELTADNTSSPALICIAAGLAAVQAIKLAWGVRSDIGINQIIEVSALDFTFTRAPVLKLPRCEVCGKSDLARQTYALTPNTYKHRDQ
ncbi:MAG TPA: TOMM precursor leader peptide-binding protein [Xanthomonadaceae bacterium]|nr:TOMM precursor leader peptide-binding protein [Xanthomonadaceae bacterium]